MTADATNFHKGLLPAAENEAVDRLVAWFTDRDNTVLRPDSAAVALFHDPEKILNDLVTANVLTRHDAPFCDEDHDLTDLGEVFPGDSCPADDNHDVRHIEVRTSFVAPRTPIRMVPALVVVHGMNTKGSWQEHITTALTSTYRYPVPITIHKYGWIMGGVILPWRQGKFVDDLCVKLKQASPVGNPHGDRPDVIAHSFGTWVLYKALLEDTSICIGHLILCGSVIPPDLDWQQFGDRVGPVLNHYSTKDLVVPFAPHVIVDSGPSGRIGFNASPLVSQRRETSFSHSSYFDEYNYENVWSPFLAAPTPENLGFDDGPLHEDGWNRPPGILRRGLVFVLWLLLLVLTLLLITSAVGIVALLVLPVLASGLIATALMLVGRRRRWN